MKSKIKVHIIGTHGVPAKYGGFETLADYLCQNLNKDFEFTVYCNANKYPDRPKTYHNAKLKYLKLDASGFKGIFYDVITYINALIYSDVILYLSPVGSGFITPLKLLFRKKVIINHGGLNEWEREKLSFIEKIWAKFNHRVASRFADVNVVDNDLYRKSLYDNFKADSVVIRYGGDHVSKIYKDDNPLLTKYPFVSEKYAVSVSRAQIDTNIHLVLEAFEQFLDYKIVLISNWEVSKYGVDLKEKYSNHPNIILLDAIYDNQELNFIRSNSYVYIHSHSRCGTAPSLVEAMNLGKPIISFDVPTNRETTKNEVPFFETSNDLAKILSEIDEEAMRENAKKMHKIAKSEYTWEIISTQYKEVINYLY